MNHEVIGYLYAQGYYEMAEVLAGRKKIRDNPVRDQKYISQKRKGYYCCQLISILNALRYYGISTPRPGGEGWEKLVDEAGCRKKPLPDFWGWAKRFGLNAEEIPFNYESIKANLPVEIEVKAKLFGGIMHHSVLVVGVQGDILIVANLTPVTKKPLTKIYWDKFVAWTKSTVKIQPPLRLSLF